MKLVAGWSARDPTSEEIRLALDFLEGALDLGLRCFDHADIYGAGLCESAFGHIWKSGLARREDLVLQSKCGIRTPGDVYGSRTPSYCFTYDHIVTAAEGILRRLRSDYLDVLLLHRPDALVEPDEVARAFADLQAAGKIRQVGVSNHTPAQMELLRRSMDMPMFANQVCINLHETSLLDAGVVAGYGEPGQALRGDDTLEYCRLHRIQVQAYAPLANGWVTGRHIPDDHPEAERLRATADKVGRLAASWDIAPEAVALSWLLRHPAGILPVVGTTQVDRLRACVAAHRDRFDHEGWYDLWITARGRKLP
jgi:predicted oxidoreductase